MDPAGVLAVALVLTALLGAIRLLGGRRGPSALLEGLFAKPWELGWPRGVQEDDDAWRHIREDASSR